MGRGVVVVWGRREVGVLCDGKGGMVSLGDIAGQTGRQVGNQQGS